MVDGRADLPCVIPAAGLSSRMGSWKPLLPWRGGTVCGRVIETAAASGLRPVLVAGHRAAELHAAFDARAGLIVADNPDWESGMLGSVRVGAAAAFAAFPDAPGFVVAPADMPLIPAEAFAGVVGAALEAERNGEGAAVFASKGGRLGHPVYIPRSYLAGMARLDPGSRLRDYLLGLRWLAVEVDDDGIFADLDSPDEYFSLVSPPPPC